MRFVRKVQIFHVNAGWPRNNDELPFWIAASDHDPVVVDLDFNQAPTSD